MITTRPVVFWIAAAVALTPQLAAHGGQYRGPGEVVPPSSGGGGSGSNTGTGSGSNDKSGGSSAGGPASSGSSRPTAASSGAATAQPSARGAAVGDDLTRWEFWWEFGKDPFLRLRDVVHGGRAIAVDDAFLNPRLAARAHAIELPTPADLQRVADRLVVVLRSDHGRDTTSACLVALAKIGLDGNNWQLRDELLPFLQRRDQEIRETAALALGIAGRDDRDTIAILEALVADDERGRKLSGNTSVNERTRAFAAFALGLLLGRTRKVAPAHDAIEALLPALRNVGGSRDLRVAAIEALSQFPRDWEGAAANALRGGVTAALSDFYALQLGPGDQLLQAHVPPAIARLLRPDDAAAAIWRERFARDLQSQLGGGPAAKTNPHIAQSCALALGNLTPAWDGVGEPDRVGKLLLRSFCEHKDHQTRRFSLLSLGRMGGAQARATLLREFDRANKALEQPWVAMALGVLATPGRLGASRSSYEPDPEIAARLRKALAEARNPSSQAGLAIALGLIVDRTASDQLRKMLQEKSHQDDLAGYLCIALGLMRDDLADGAIRDLMRAATRRPHVVFHCAQALGLLGDPEVTTDLCRELTGDEPSLVRLSAAASALGQIGDRRSLEPLLAMLTREDITPLTRAFAVVGLGSVCDKDPLPWNAAYATNCNYRASTSTLTDGAAGILDIL